LLYFLTLLKKDNQMPHAVMRAKYFLVLLLGLMLTGCFQTTEHVYLNPNGSGKTVIDATFTPFYLNLSDEEPEPRQEMNNAVKNILEKSEGVDAWSDVSYALNNEGKIHFKGTAYFRHIEKLKIANLGSSELEYRAHDNGQYTLTYKNDRFGKVSDKTSLPSGGLTEEQIQARIREEKAKYQRSRKLLALMLSDLRHESHYHLPGEILGSSNFDKVSANHVQLILEGEKILTVADDVFKSDSYWRDHVTSGNQKKKNTDNHIDIDLRMPPNDFNKHFFGEQGPVSVDFRANAPLFDYNKEVATVRKGEAAIFSALSSSLAPSSNNNASPKPASSGEMPTLAIGKIEMVHSLIDDDTTRRLLYAEPGFKLTLVSQFDQPVLKITEAILNQAKADNGQNLLPDRRYERTARSTRLSNDKHTGIMEFKLVSPGKEVDKLAILEGQITYQTAGKSAKHDLGISQLVKGHKGKMLGAEVKGFEQFNDKRYLVLFLDIPVHEIKQIRVFDGQGKLLETKRSGYSASNNSVNLNLECKCTWPQNARIEVDKYTNLQEYIVPIHMENIDILGRTQPGPPPQLRPTSSPVPAEKKPTTTTLKLKAADAQLLTSRFRPITLQSKQHKDFTAYLFTGDMGDNQAYRVASNKRAVYVGTEKGLLRYDKKTGAWSVLDKQQNLPGEMVWDIAADDHYLALDIGVHREKRNYVASSGVYFYDEDKGSWEFVHKSADGLLMHQGDLWIGNTGRVLKANPVDSILSSYDAENLPLLKDNRLYDIASDGKDVWVAIGGKLNRDLRKFLGGGIAQFDTTSGTWQAYTVKDGLGSEYVTGVAADENETWASHWEEEDGLSLLDRKTGKWRTIRKSSNGIEIGGPRLALDKDYVWVGQQRGLLRLDRKTHEAKLIKEAHGLPGYIISGLAVDEEGVWAAAYSYKSGEPGVRSSGVIFIPNKQADMVASIKKVIHEIINQPYMLIGIALGITILLGFKMLLARKN
jgi:hypothetical protein